MPFRDDRPAQDAGLLERFVELTSALALPGDVPGRSCALALLTATGDPQTLASTVHRTEQYLRTLASEMAGLTIDPTLSRVLAAQLAARGDEPIAFVKEVVRVREMFRVARLRQGGLYGVLGIQMLRLALGGAAIQAHHLRRLRELYVELRGHHWLLTGPDDYPTCALLVEAEGTPAQLGQRAEDLYQGLRRDAGQPRGEALQTTANLLCLSELAPDEIVERYGRLLAQLPAAGVPIGGLSSDCIALLCFVATSVRTLTSVVLDSTVAVGHALDRATPEANAPLACMLLFAQTVGRRRGPILDAKLLLDTYAVVRSREAASAVQGGVGP